MPNDGDALAELIRLWSTMGCAASRRAMLNVARALATAQAPPYDGVQRPILAAGGGR